MKFCLSTDLFTNIVTFRKEDATLQFPTFQAGASGDIRFQFMTTAMDGIILQNTGQFDFIEVRIVCELSYATKIYQNSYKRLKLLITQVNHINAC